MPRSLTLLAAFLLLPLAQAGSPKVAAPPPDTADAAFARKDFRKALAFYRGELAKRRDAAKERRIVSCLAALEDWDEALREGEAYLGRHADTLDGVRGRRLVADVYLRAPHWGFKEGSVLRRGGERREGERVWLQREDQEAALGHLEAAREVLYLFEDARLPETGRVARPTLVAEIVATDLDLADVLQGRWWHGPMPEPRASRVRDRYFAPRKEWAAFLRADDLYREVVALGTGRKHRHPAALAFYASALARHRVRAAVERLKQADRPLTADETEALRRLGEPEADLRSLEQRYPGDPLIDEALFAAGRILEERGEPSRAEAVYEDLQARHSPSLWASDARAALQDLRRKDLSFESTGPLLPGRPAALALTSRNVSSVAFTAYRVDPEQALLNPAHLQDPQTNFQDSERLFGPAGAARGGATATWDHATGDDGSRRSVTAKVQVPSLPRGAYLVEARGEGVAFATLVVVSDLALVQKVAIDRVLLFVADAVTGQPVEGAAVVVRQSDRWSDARRVVVRRGRTAADGSVSLPLAMDMQFTNVEAVALLGDRVAVTPLGYVYGSGERAGVRVHLTTDRPAYRPSQTVHFRGLALRLQRTGEAPCVQTRVTVIVRDPRGNELYRHEHVTDAFGVFSGSLTLGDEPPLGEYPIEVQVQGEGRVQAAGNQFRVEEYRKPDFEVSVEAGGALRAGETGRAEIVARYYFGSPVTDAAVTWRVLRTMGPEYYPFHDPHEWLYGVGYGRHFWGGPPSRQLVAQGTGRTDSQGRARIEWPTAAGQDARYEVEADVVDLSRREVKGAGSVRATRAAFGLYLRSDRGFYRPGENATLEVAAADANGKPVAVGASLKVLRRTWSSLRETVTEQTVSEQPLSLGATGRADVGWTPAEAGEFRLVVAAFDPRQEKVEAELVLRVAEEETRSDLFRLSGVELTVERTDYREGETAEVLLASSRPGAVLLTEEAGGEILGHRVVLLGGKGRVVKVALTRAHAPNVFLRATQVGEGQVYVAQREVFVPPEERFLSVEARPRSATVKPGEAGVIDLVVKDAAGRPVSASLSLAVTDRSVEAIQVPYAPDVRAFFYGGRRGLQVQETSSFAFKASGSVRRDRKEVAHRRHGTPPGWYGGLRGKRRDWAGDELGGFEMAEEQPAVASVAPAAAQALRVGGAIMMNGGMAEGRVAAKMGSMDSLERGEKKEAGAGFAEARTRSVFADTAYWSAAVLTGPDGRATVSVSYPDSLTDWKVVARGGDARARVGEAVASVIARKDLMVRLQSPRFFVERDRALLSALVQNDLPEAVEAVARLEVSSVLRLSTPAEVRVHVESHGQARVEWPVEVVGDGQAKIQVSALTTRESDAAEMTFAALVHGTDKQVSQAGRLEAGESREIEIEVPAERGPGTARLTLTLSPSLVSTLIEAVPYLLDYPYGCVEQTLSRFLPAVVLSRMLKETGASLEDLAQRRHRLLTDDRVSAWRHRKDPVFRTAELDEMVRAGLGRLAAFQNEEGGWGWWKGDSADVRMSAYVVYGLVTAQKAGHPVDTQVLERGVSFLESHVKDETSLHARAYAAFALATAGRRPVQLDALLARRGDLSVYGKALLALALQRSGRVAEARLVVSNLEDLARVDEPSDTASWPVASEWWWWENDPVETQAFVLWALAEVRPEHPLAPRAARWLLLNRQGSRWRSTRDTAHAIYALSAFARGAGEAGGDLTAEVTLGSVAKSFRITRENALAFDDSLVVGDADLGSGRKTLRIRTSGTGVLYYHVVLRYFTREEDISGAGTTLRVRRDYFKKVPKVVEEAGVRRLEHDRVPLASLASVKSGDEVEVKLTIESPTPYDHLVFEDPKPAGFEPVDMRSGGRYGDGLCSNMELRDERVAFFITHLAQGTQVIRYTLRAETPGAYHALPAHGFAMYAPEIAALADEWRGTVEP